VISVQKQVSMVPMNSACDFRVLRKSGASVHLYRVGGNGGG
jgi:hypothetical protein